MSSLKSLLARNAGTAALMLMLCASLGLNVFLAHQAGYPRKAVVTLKENMKLPSPLPVLDADGNPVSLAFDDSRPTVIYVLSPQCGWCKKNEANIKAVTAIAGSRYNFVGLSLVPTDLKQYIAAGRAPFPVYQIESQDQAQRLGLSATPTTIVVGPGAKVLKVWTGAYMDKNQPEVEKYFGAKLPGLQEVAQATQP
jgi:hypothetical protein